ncbi:MAG: MFS transporter [Armatimonadota bacterium]|nr:MFS transporter [Armatimonadota bacterium]
MSSREKQKTKISGTVITLGVVSLLTDISSEGVYPLIPLFLTETLRARVLAVGLIEGVAESTASILRIFSGWLSDVLRNRKWLTVGGYSLSALSKPLLSLATSWHYVFGIRFMDRLGKGIRTAPRDALIADVAPTEARGVSFGLHRAMDSLGATLGPLIAFLLILYGIKNYRQLFLLAFIPAAIAVLILIAFVREPRRETSAEVEIPSLRISSFSRQFKLFLLITTIFSIGNSSDAFLILRAKDVGVSAASTLLIYVLFNSVDSIFSTAAGALSDKVGRRNVVLAGYLLFALVYTGFALARSPATIWLLFGTYGLYNALTHGVQKAFASDLIEAGFRGTGMGAYHMLTGIALFPASLIAGYLWDSIGPPAPFYFGAVTALTSALLLVICFRSSNVIYSDR